MSQSNEVRSEVEIENSEKGRKIEKVGAEERVEMRLNDLFVPKP